MRVRKFNVYLADLSPRFGTETGKTRPVVVLQTNLLNDSQHPSTIVCPITTQVIHGAEILRVHLAKKGVGLKKDSDILVDQIRAIDNRRFVKHLGELSSVDKAKLVENLKIILFE
ncbi:MAG TPA: type II toxin-antitoxin system PemK/MazF family toxin [bacterium]|nr:type II toxin-antitoxin system PemK/MazF family toxin [bacterium]